MKAMVKTPNMTQYFFQFEPSDELYHRCTWAEINLDHDSYTMSAASDCGNYTYGWHPTPTAESFRKLMARLNNGYLLDKISTERFDFDASKEALLKMVKDDGMEEYIILDVELMDECGEEYFIVQAEKLTNYGFESIPAISEHPAAAKSFAMIFTKYLQPILREELQKQ